MLMNPILYSLSSQDQQHQQQSPYSSDQMVQNAFTIIPTSTASFPQQIPVPLCTNPSNALSKLPRPSDSLHEHSRPSPNASQPDGLLGQALSSHIMDNLTASCFLSPNTYAHTAHLNDRTPPITPNELISVDDNSHLATNVTRYGLDRLHHHLTGFSHFNAPSLVSSVPQQQQQQSQQHKFSTISNYTDSTTRSASQIPQPHHHHHHSLVTLMPMGAGHVGMNMSRGVIGSSSSARINCNLGSKDRRPCDICGDISAGFHCNAYVCEACKKFFIRSSKGENFSKYTCTKSNTCEINKDTRTHCQRCRYQKCLRLGMVLPGAAVFPATDISEIPCRVCGAKSSGFHFGAITCEGCKGFFRRTINEREGQRYTCRNGGTCTVTGATRNNCKSCRYQRCLSVGMSKDGSRIGRQPNAVKHRCAIEIEQLRSAVQPTFSNPPTPSPNKYYHFPSNLIPSQPDTATNVVGRPESRVGQYAPIDRNLLHQHHPHHQQTHSSPYLSSTVPNVNVICLRGGRSAEYSAVQSPSADKQIYAHDTILPSQVLPPQYEPHLSNSVRTQPPAQQHLTIDSSYRPQTSVPCTSIQFTPMKNSYPNGLITSIEIDDDSEVKCEVVEPIDSRSTSPVVIVGHSVPKSDPDQSSMQAYNASGSQPAFGLLQLSQAAHFHSQSGKGHPQELIDFSENMTSARCSEFLKPTSNTFVQDILSTSIDKQEMNESSFWMSSGVGMKIMDRYPLMNDNSEQPQSSYEYYEIKEDPENSMGSIQSVGTIDPMVGVVKLEQESVSQADITNELTNSDYPQNINSMESSFRRKTHSVDHRMAASDSSPFSVDDEERLVVVDQQKRHDVLVNRLDSHPSTVLNMMDTGFRPDTMIHSTSSEASCIAPSKGFLHRYTSTMCHKVITENMSDLQVSSMSRSNGACTMDYERHYGMKSPLISLAITPATVIHSEPSDETSISENLNEATEVRKRKFTDPISSWSSGVPNFNHMEIFDGPIQNEHEQEEPNQRQSDTVSNAQSPTSRQPNTYLTQATFMCSPKSNTTPSHVEQMPIDLDREHPEWFMPYTSNELSGQSGCTESQHLTYVTKHRRVSGNCEFGGISPVSVNSSRSYPCSREEYLHQSYPNVTQIDKPTNIQRFLADHSHTSQVDFTNPRSSPSSAESDVMNAQVIADTVTDVICSHLASRGAMSLELFTDRVMKAARVLRINTRQESGNPHMYDPTLSGEQIWERLMNNFEIYAHRVIQFARAIPGFRELTTMDMKALVQQSVYPITITLLSVDYRSTTKEYNFFNLTNQECTCLFSQFPGLQSIAEHLQLVGRVIAPLNLDESELALLFTLEIFHGRAKTFDDPSRVGTLYQNAVSSLKKYEMPFTSNQKRTEQLLNLLPLLTQIHKEFQLIVCQLREKHCGLPFSDLFLQMFQSDGSSDQSHSNRQ